MKINKPTISIIVPTLNEEKFLPNLLQSLSEQSEKDFEVIVVDGHSKDKTKEVALAYKNKLTDFDFILAPKAGVSLQRNLGAKKSRGEYLVFLDADSVVLPYFVERVRNYINTHAQTQVFTSWFRPDGDTPEDIFMALMILASVEGSIYFHRPWAPGPLTIIKRSTFEDIHGYDESMSFGEDYDLGMRLYEKKIILQVIRETIYVYSLRRLRNEGKLRVLPKYIRATLSVIFTKHGPKHMPGYITGGHIYQEKKKQRKKSGSPDQVLKQFKNSLQKLIKEFVA